jgi:hypothetical protein
MQAFQALMGRPPRVEPLLVQRGLSAAALSEV